jgi:hypothetical protein
MMNRQESHRIYLQLFAATPPKASDGSPLNRKGNYHAQPPSESFSLSATLFEGSSRHTVSHPGAAHTNQRSDHPSSQDEIRFVSYPPTVTTSAAVRLTDKAKVKDVTALLRGKFGLPPIQHQKQREYITYEAARDEDGIVDALVLVGTMDRPPKGYLRYEHESLHEEKQRIAKFLQSQSQSKQPAGTDAHKIDPHTSSGSSVDTNMTSNMNSYATDRMHFDMSEGETTEYDMEPIHIFRTLLPEEHPLIIRDEVMSLITELRQRAENEMGCHLTIEGGERELKAQYPPQPTFRWYFQPCSPLGGSSALSDSPKIQCTPAYIDVEGYCTEDESESESDEENSSDKEDMINDETSYDLNVSANCQDSQMRHKLIEERCRSAFLKDLSSDMPFIVTGYLLKQSWRDPNVWRRVYCVLSDDRMWTVGRMKRLKNKCIDTSSNDILPCMRTGRHRYFTLHQSQLIEKGMDDVLIRQHSSSRYSGYYLTPLGQRLPNTFRVITSQGKCHTFRAFNQQSFRLWVSSISESIAQKGSDANMNLANLIAEEETTKHRRRLDDIAISPLGLHNYAELKRVSMDVVRFGIAVAEFCKLNDAILQRSAVNAQPGTSAAGRTNDGEHVRMMFSIWEVARVVASKSAQLIHSLTVLHHDKLGEDRHHSSILEDLVEEQKKVSQTLLATTTDSLPSMQLFDHILQLFQLAL